MEEIVLSETAHTKYLGIRGIAIIPCQVLIYAKVAW